MDIVEFSKSQRNKPIAIRLGYIYNLHRSSNEKQDWRCKEYFKTKCPATIQTKDDILLKSKNLHNHSCDPDEASAHMAYSKMKDYAKSVPSELPGQIVGKFSMDLGDETLSKLPAPDHLKKTLYNKKRTDLPPLPANLASVTFPDHLITCEYGNDQENMLIFDSGPETGEDRIIVFGVKPQLEYLERCRVLICDSTFATVPSLTFQLYTIHSLVGVIASLLFFALLPNKTTATYTKMNEILIKTCPNLSPEIILTDFEKAAITSFERSFPDSLTGGCFFHLCQSIIRNVNEIGLKIKYVNDKSFRLRVKSLYCLAFMPVALVIEFFEVLSNQFNDDEMALVDYFERTYIGAMKPRTNERRQPLYDPSFWNMRDRSDLGAPKTTNHSEGWHGRLNAANHQNPNMWTFLEILKVEITLVRRELLDYRLGGEKRKRAYIKDMNKRLKNLCDRPIPEADKEKLELLNSFALLF